MRIFIDQTAWVQVVNKDAPHHQQVVDELNKVLLGGDKLFTHNVAVGFALNEILEKQGSAVAGKFNEIIDEAHTGTHLNILWISRRTQKEAARLLRKKPDAGLGIFDFAGYILMRRRRIRTIITTKAAYNSLELKVIPELKK